MEPWRFIQLLEVSFCVMAATVSATAQDTTCVSIDSSGAQGTDDSGFYDLSPISADGNVVAFTSNASNLVPNDNNYVSDVFVHDRTTGVTERVSVDSSGTEGNDKSYFPALSADGQLVAFVSFASNLVSGDNNVVQDIFVHDRSTGLTERVNVDSSGVEANDVNYYATLSANGRIVAFESNATNLVAGDKNGQGDVFVHDRGTGVTERVSVDSSGKEGNDASADLPLLALSNDGSIVSFESKATNLVAGDTNGNRDVFVHDRSTGITELVSVRSNGAQGNGDSDWPSLSANGRFVAFESGASNLVTGDTNGSWDIFVHDRATGNTNRVDVSSLNVEANAGAGAPSLSADGSRVAFNSSSSNLVVGDTAGFNDVFVRERSLGVTERVSVDSAGAQSDGDSWIPKFSADGNAIAFGSVATNLVSNDVNGFSDVFVHERCSIPASWNNYGAGFAGSNGVPTFTSRQNPVLATTITLDLANSYGNPTAGLLFVGFQQTNLHSNWGGDLLVVPALVVTITFSYSGDTFTGAIPDDLQLCGLTLDLQAIEADPGAAKGVSFTPGLELILGH